MLVWVPNTSAFIYTQRKMRPYTFLFWTIGCAFIYLFIRTCVCVSTGILCFCINAFNVCAFFVTDNIKLTDRKLCIFTHRGETEIRAPKSNGLFLLLDPSFIVSTIIRLHFVWLKYRCYSKKTSQMKEKQNYGIEQKGGGK